MYIKMTLVEIIPRIVGEGETKENLRGEFKYDIFDTL
jgi:hypothetical protein